MLPSPASKKHASSPSSPRTLPLSRRLGPNPLWNGLLFWGSGIAFCLLAWCVHKLDHVTGSILLGLSTFVNLFCFFQGLNHIRRAWARWRTLAKAKKMRLNPERTACGAAFVVIDTTRGTLVCNGRAVNHRDITRIVSSSTVLAHKLVLYGCGRWPLVMGFPDRESLLLADRQLCAEVLRFRGEPPEYARLDESA